MTESSESPHFVETAFPIFPIVGIGSSAGGLEALSEFLCALPAAPGMAFLLVQHLDPAHESLLADLLAKHTSLPVTQVKHDEPIHRDHIYVIAPNTTLTISAGRLHVVERPAAQPHVPIDELFQSLAKELGHRGIGVVLSGGGSDGTRGLGAIKEAAGITFAQDPASAKFAAMSRSAIESGAVDFIARPSEIARELLRIRDHPYVRAAFERPPAPAEERPSVMSDEQQLKAIFRLLRNTSGVDFTHYKRSTVQRRLARRLAVHHAESLANYVTLLQEDANEQRALVHDLLIRVTNFFRDPETFETLSRSVLPALLKNRSANDPLRIWVPGCSTGEEVYSIAICLFEFLGASANSTEIQIFGTDVSELAIERARAGRYLHTIAAEVSAQRLERFFVKLDDHYQITKSVRDRCIFATQNVARDPPFSRLDLVSCRNLLIYLDPTLQRKALTLFHYALKPDGFLLLGNSESVGQGAELFELVDKRHHIFARKAMPTHSIGTFEGRASHPASTAVRAEADELVQPEARRTQREADRILARYGPASVIIDEDLNVIEFRGDTEPYLEFSPGAASLSLHRLARPGLLVALSPAIQAARQNGASAQLHVTDLRGASGTIDVHLNVIPLPAIDGEARCYLIVFQPVAVQRESPPDAGCGRAGLGRQAMRPTCSAPPRS
jgi:two-component system CheB/CheR fusion protein